MGLSMYLIFANNAKVGGSAKAPLEQRYNTGLSICVALSLFSGFFNILQMTGLDDFELPRSENFTLDLSRPLEWLLTCPLQQYVLVIVGGARLAPWRKFVQPLVTAGNLLCGIAAMFSTGGMEYGWFAFGFCLFCTYSYFACQMIEENSDGEESFFRGDSDYRKMIIITILTWFPFPIWFVLSPEGLGIVNDVVLIQLGWATLNIISKFSFVIHLQLAKNRYCKTLNATRELYGVQDMKDVPKDMKDIQDEPDAEGNQDEKMKTLIGETMVSLGMSAHTARFQKLMLDNGVVSTDILERLTEDRAIDLNLPWSLCEAVQKRWRTEKMSMGQDGEAHQKEDPFKKLLEDGKQRGKRPQVDADMLQQILGQAIPGLPGTATPPLAASLLQDGERRLENLEANLALLLQQQQQMMYTIQGVADKVEKFDGAQEAICQRMDFSQQAQMQTLNSSQVLLHKVDSSQEVVMQKVTAHTHLLENLKGGQQSIYESMSGANDANREALVDSVDKNSKALLTKLDNSQQQLLKNQSSAFDLISQVHRSQEIMSSKTDSHQETSTRRFNEAQNAMEQTMSTLAQGFTKNCEASTGQMKKMVLDEMNGLYQQSGNFSEHLQTGLAAQEERVSDIRRQNMMIMDMLTTTQERVHESADTISSFARTAYQQDHGARLEVELRGVVSSEIQKLQRDLYQTMGLTSSSDYGENEYGSSSTPTTGGASMLAAAAERIEKAVLRMDSTPNSGSMEQVVRHELSAVAMALAQQQRESAEQQLQQVGQAVRSELRETSGSLQSKVEQFEGALDSSMERFEKGVDKVLSASDDPKDSRRKTTRADRG